MLELTLFIFIFVYVLGQSVEEEKDLFFIFLNMLTCCI